MHDHVHNVRILCLNIKLQLTKNRGDLAVLQNEPLSSLNKALLLFNFSKATQIARENQSSFLAENNMLVTSLSGNYDH
jgi:hypothetical protein